MTDIQQSDDPIKKRINKILESRLDTDKVKITQRKDRVVRLISSFQEAIEALTDLSTFFHENTLQTRRQLRSQIEKRSLVINEVHSSFVWLNRWNFNRISFHRIFSQH